MKKNLIALAVVAAIASPLAAQAADSASVSGYGDIRYDSKSKGFNAKGEIDTQKTVGSVTARVDVDLNLSTAATDPNTNFASSGKSANLEQVFFAYNPIDALTVIGGVFNNPIGQEAQDAPDFSFTTHSAVYNILNYQTALYANNLAGLAVAGGLGPVTLTGAVVNDIGGSAGKKSYAIVANIAPVKGLDLEAGYVTQQKNTGYVANTAGIIQAGNVWDVNGKYNLGKFTLATDVLGAADIIDLAYQVWGSFNITDELSVRVRYDAVKYNNGVSGGTSNRVTGYLRYTLEDNLYVALETSKGTSKNALDSAVTGIIEGSKTTVQFVANF